MATFEAQLPPFDLKTAIVLITGGSSGIGASLVDEFVKRGSRVLITGRREAELKSVQDKHGKDAVLKYYVGDAGLEADRVALFQRSTSDYPQLNVLINNAGIQRRGDHRKEIAEPWSERQKEIDINLSGPIHLTSLFIPHMIALSQPSAIIQVTSGLSFVAFTSGPIYSATKAGVHLYTLAVRPLLADTKCRMVELIPPAVRSNLGGSHDFGEDTAEFCSHAVDRFVEGKLEFGYKFSEEARLASRQRQQELQFGLMKQQGPVQTF